MQQIDIFTIAAIANVTSMTTISVTKRCKRKTIEGCGPKIQMKMGRRVDLNDALRFLVDQRKKNPRLLEEACSPTSGVKEALEELETERKLDDERLERKLAIDTSALIELLYCDSLGRKLQNLVKPNK